MYFQNGLNCDLGLEPGSPKLYIVKKFYWYF